MLRSPDMGQSGQLVTGPRPARTDPRAACPAARRLVPGAGVEPLLRRAGRGGRAEAPDSRRPLLAGRPGPDRRDRLVPPALPDPVRGAGLGAAPPAGARATGGTRRDV